MIRLALLALLLALLPASASAQIYRPIVAGTRHGCADVSVGAAWSASSSVSTEDSAGSAALASGLTAAFIFVRNTHATQTLYVCLAGSGCGADTANKLAVAADATLTLDVYGMNVTSVSLQGSGAATTGQLCVHWLPN